MSIYTSTRAEWLKTKRTASLYVCIIVASLMPLLLLLEYSTIQEAANTLKADPWNLYFAEGLNGVNFILLTLCIILVSTLLAQIEYRNNTWKQLLASPQRLDHIFLAKFLVFHIYILIFFMAYYLLMLTTAIVVHFYNPEFGFFTHPIDWSRLAFTTFKTYISVLAVSATQFWLSIRFKNFIAPVGMGLAMWVVAGLIVFEFHWEQAYLFPFTYPLLIGISFINTSSIHVFGMYELGSMIYTILLLGLAYKDFKRLTFKA